MDRVTALVPLAHVADVTAAAAFYAKLGFEIVSRFVPPDEDPPAWVWLRSGRAELMLGRASEPVESARQAVLFYLYCPDLAALHARLARAGLEPGPIATPFYNPGGEFRLVDPDGYVVMVAQSEQAPS